MPSPNLRKNIKNILSKNKSLQKILSPSTEALEVTSVEQVNYQVHNTKTIVLVNENGILEERTLLYDRLDLATLLQDATINQTTIELIVSELNDQGFDFTTDDLEIGNGEVLAKPTSLGYIGSVEANVSLPVEQEDPPPPPPPPPLPPSALYDPFYQMVHVTGTPGSLAVTEDEFGNILGSTVIDSDGSTSYPINEDNYDRSVPIFNKIAGVLISQDVLTVSFVLEETTSGLAPFVNFKRNKLDFADVSYTGAYAEIVPSSTEAIIINYVNYDTNEKVTREATFDNITSLYQDYNWMSGSRIRAYVRYKTTNPMFTNVQIGDKILKFFDNGVNVNMGYQLRGSETNPRLKQIPAYLPKCVTNLNYMFANGIVFTINNSYSVGDYFTFETPAVADNLANWDVSHVKTAHSLFRCTSDTTLPISNWNWAELTAGTNMFFQSGCDGLGVSSLNSWKTPKLTAARQMFYDAWCRSNLSGWCVPLLSSMPIDFYVKPTGLPSGLEAYPVWGTCPV